jgi:hypothetical protein
VAESPHLRERFVRVGVGVFAEKGSSGPGLWITVIYAGS